MDFTHKGNVTINGYADSGLSVSICGNDVDVDSRLFKILIEENTQLKADKAEFLVFIQSIPDDVADIFEWHEANNFCVDELIQKHKGAIE